MRSALLPSLAEARGSEPTGERSLTRIRLALLPVPQTSGMIEEFYE